MRREGDLLFDSAVNGEGTGDDQGEYGYDFRDGDHINEADYGKEKSDLFPFAQPFLENDHADHGNNDGFDKIAETGIEDMAAVDGVNVNAPIDCDKDPGEKGNPQIAPMMKELSDLTDLAGEDHKEHHKHHGPDDSLGENIDGRNFAEEIPEKGKESPADVSGGNGKCAGGSLIFHCSVAAFE